MTDAKLTLIKPPPPSKQVLDMATLDAETRKLVEECDDLLYPELQRFRTIVAKQTLRVGKILHDIYERLPKGIFVKWARKVEYEINLPLAKTYRWKAIYEEAIRKLPPAVIHQAIAMDIPLFGNTERAPYGRYTHVIPLLPPPPNDEEKARVWITMMREKEREMKMTRRAKGSRMDSVAHAIVRAYLANSRNGPFDRWFREVKERTEKELAERQEKE